MGDPQVNETDNRDSLRTRGPQSENSTSPGDSVSTDMPRIDVGEEVSLSGTSLGSYRLFEKLGQGGMGTVYRAIHASLNKVVAIKVLRLQSHNLRNAAARFEQEMKAVGMLSHPNIVQAFDAGQVDGTQYIAMEFIEGVDLQRLVRMRGPLPISDAANLVVQAALALGAAHAAKLIHRDVKAANLLLSNSGQVKLLDLGLALLAEEHQGADRLTFERETFGTADYMAPEQWNDARSADARTDLYALGCVLYFLLTGDPPYSSENYPSLSNKMKGHVLDPVPNLLLKRSDAPGELARVFEKLMAKHPDHRYQSAANLVEDLRVFCTAPGANQGYRPDLRTMVEQPGAHTDDRENESVDRWRTEKIAPDDDPSNKHQSSGPNYYERSNASWGRGGLGAVYHRWNRDRIDAERKFRDLNGGPSPRNSTFVFG